MKKSLTSLTSLLLCVLLISCQKENSETPATSSIAGTYKFIVMDMNGVATSTVTNGGDVERAVTVTKYRTKNNSGTINITASTFASVNLSYEIDTMIAVSYYTNGNLDMEMDVPFQFQLPASSSTSNYKIIGSDSIYFSSGTMFVDGSTTQSTQGNGGRFRKEGNLLIMTAPTNQTKTETHQGLLVTSRFNGVATITLQKQ